MKPSIAIPLSIVVAGLFIAGAVYLINNPSSGSPAQNQGETPQVRPVDATDHLLGNPGAPVVLIEYSDLECPFCKNFHETMHTLMDEYGPTGQVAWVYRHFPLEALHSKAPKEAEASECVAELGGNDAFWKFIDRVFAVTPSSDGLDLSTLPDIAEYAGVDRAKFSACYASGKYAEKVKAGFDEAVVAGAQGTPHTFIAVAGTYLSLDGAQPYSSMKAAIDAVLGELDKRGTTGGASQ